MVSSKTRVSEDVLVEWSFYRFYRKVVYISDINAYQKRLTEIVSRA